MVVIRRRSKTKTKSAKIWDAVIVGAGCAGLSAAIYLARAMRRVLVVDSGKSLAVLPPDVENYLGFPEGISGKELLQKGKRQARRFGAVFEKDHIREGRSSRGGFILRGRRKTYHARRLLLATGILHIPPEIPSVEECVGRGMYFCKDCDGLKVKKKPVVVIGIENDTAEFALALTCYTPRIFLATNGSKPKWNKLCARLLERYKIPVLQARITTVQHTGECLTSLEFADGKSVTAHALFTAKGDIVKNSLAKSFGVRMDESGFIIVDKCMRTSKKGVYSAGCVTQANCQMIIAAGGGATAAQAINRNLFEEDVLSL
jgi:thioredoxin reductase (NADPH)